MPKIFKNKYSQLYYELQKFCKKCKDIDCPSYKPDCAKVVAKYNELLYDFLYPSHPCKVCLVRAACNKTLLCESLEHHFDMQDVARAELKGDQIYFSKNKTNLLQKPPNLITKEDLKAIDFDGKGIDFEFTKKYIEEIKNDSNYEEVFKAQKQRSEFYSNYKFMKYENGRWINDKSHISS